MKSKKLVILGNGGAAINAIKAIRSVDHTSQIIQISDIPGPAFNPMLAPYYLKGKISWHRCFPFGNDFYEKHDVICIFGSRVESLDALKKKVFLSNSKSLHYDQCLIATGATPTIPSISGLKESSKTVSLRTAKDTKDIEKAISSAKKVLIIGASLIGIKLAEILCKKGIQVILSDIVNQVLPKGAHKETASFLEKYLISNGIETRLECSLDRLEEDRKGTICYFPRDIRDEVDFVVVCAGIRPNTDFVDPSQIDMEEAILVDRTMSTSAEDVYAGGDVCQGMNRQSNIREYLGTWGNACHQGRTAGLNMTGEFTTYPGIIPQYISPFFDWTYAQVGDVSPIGNHTRIATDGNPFRGSYRLLVFKDNIIVGANLINCSHEVGITRSAIINKLTREDYIKKLNMT